MKFRAGAVADEGVPGVGDRDFRGGMAERRRSQTSAAISAPKTSTNALRRWMFRLSITKWMVFASGYAMASVTATWANSKPERSGVAKVK